MDDSGVTVTDGGGDITNAADATGLKIKSSQASFTKEVLLLHAKDTTGFDLIKGVVNADSGSGTTAFKVDSSGKVTAAGGMTIESTGLKVAGGVTVDNTGQTISAGGLKVAGGATVDDAGLTISGGGFKVAGGVTVDNTGQTISAGGLNDAAGGAVGGARMSI